MKKDYKEVLHVLTELHKDHPNYTLATHIALATADYGDLWGVSDKDLLAALLQYQEELALDTDRVVSPEYIKQLEEDAKHLFDPEEDEY